MKAKNNARKFIENIKNQIITFIETQIRNIYFGDYKDIKNISETFESIIDTKNYYVEELAKPSNRRIINAGVTIQTESGEDKTIHTVHQIADILINKTPEETEITFEIAEEVPKNFLYNFEKAFNVEFAL